MLTLNDLNPNLISAQYAVRGPIVIRAQDLEKQGKEIIYCNIGNPQALKQKPLTFIRQMLAALEYPKLISNDETSKDFPEDIIRRTREILSFNPHGMGAYTQSAGLPFIRKAVADFISKRDNINSSPENIILTDGASKGVQAVIIALRKTKLDGFMIPVPQYPLYSATIQLYGASQIEYYLDEENSWQLNEKILTESYNNAKIKGINPVCIVVINPGNPTGTILSYDNISKIINFAKKHRLSIVADEVYQENIYKEGAKFYSFAKVMNDMGENEISLFSFHSVSKGFLGECGHRGGYMEMRNIPGDVRAMMIKQQSISLCANTTGQIVTYLMVSPPSAGEESYGTYTKEKAEILSELKEKAGIIGKGLNEIDGLSVEIPQGAMYAFVKLNLPHTKDITKMTPEERLEYDSKRDNDYCMSLLEETGICVVPGSGFGQAPGTLHFRTTFLPPKEQIDNLVLKMKTFHNHYISRLITNIKE